MPLEDFIEQTKIKCNYFLLNFNYKNDAKIFLRSCPCCSKFRNGTDHVKTMTLHTLCGIHAGKGNEQETIMDYKTSKLYKQNEKVILFIQPSYGNSNRIKFV